MRYVGVMLLALLPAAGFAQDRLVVQLPGAVPQGLPFSPAVRTGNLIFLSADNFFRRVVERRGVLTRTAPWRSTPWSARSPPRRSRTTLIHKRVR